MIGRRQEVEALLKSLKKTIWRKRTECVPPSFILLWTQGGKGLLWAGAAPVPTLSLAGLVAGPVTLHWLQPVRVKEPPDLRLLPLGCVGDYSPGDSSQSFYFEDPPLP